MVRLERFERPTYGFVVHLKPFFTTFFTAPIPFNTANKILTVQHVICIFTVKVFQSGSPYLLAKCSQNVH